jgi:hypothetical protein
MAVAFIVQPGEISDQDRFGINHGWRYRFSAVSGPQGPNGETQTILFITEVRDPAAFDAFAAKALEIAVTVRFSEAS